MWRCPYCETFNEDTDNFCAICGGSKTAEPQTGTAPETANPAAQAPVSAAPSPRPRPANMWDNADGLGGAVDLKALAAKREAEHREKKVRDAEIRKKLAAAKPDTDKDAEYERLKYEGVTKQSDNNHGLLTAFIVLIIIVLLMIFISKAGSNSSTNTTNYAVVTESNTDFRKGPGSDYSLLDTMEEYETIEYLEVIMTDQYGNEWCKVSRDGTVGYIERDYLDIK